jgi:hypothetical protein
VAPLDVLLLKVEETKDKSRNEDDRCRENVKFHNFLKVVTGHVFLAFRKFYRNTNMHFTHELKVEVKILLYYG